MTQKMLSKLSCCRLRNSLLLCRESLDKSNADSYWLTYGQVAIAKSKCCPTSNNSVVIARSASHYIDYFDFSLSYCFTQLQLLSAPNPQIF